MARIHPTRPEYVALVRQRCQTCGALLPLGFTFHPGCPGQPPRAPLPDERTQLWRAVQAALCPTVPLAARDHLLRARLAVTGSRARIVAESRPVADWLRLMMARQIEREIKARGVTVESLEFAA